MIPLNSAKSCEKCGRKLSMRGTTGTHARSRYVAARDLCSDDFDCKCHTIETRPLEGNEPMSVEEHIERTCPRCSYVWAERVTS